MELLSEGHEYTFTMHGKPCKVARYENDSASRVAAYQGMLSDVYKMKSFLELACNISETLQTGLQLSKLDPNDKGKIICSSLYLSSISIYGKCFTKATGRNVKLEDSDLKKKLSPIQSATHDRLKYPRNNWAAHGGISDHEALTPVFLFTETSAIPAYIATSIAMSPLDDMKDMLSLCGPIIELISEKVEKHEQDVFKGDPLPILCELREQAEESLIIPKAPTP